ncbi:translocation/assembly module TamB domain-containing protein [Haliscomenobacter hydrossis]|uniref:Translocation and assembly module TamB C-terminal domain-containing protein n=1 Tax=Haliscomenobacter hydrossis (strain ATCC 27775 / DSM 1100 / LMG 10767 / O) TaxID=760192 RepID=F4L105_HALH1|nr:translocation/assembly module TamB domain-containing protein [Haliscomenobacter hydrossis]AEE51592.1 protein of unknown function DUF490 [Haliscomenobacter hydrossis DSM 1100]
MRPNEVTKKNRPLLTKIGRGIIVFFFSIVLLLALLLLLLQTKPVQNFARKKIVAYLEQKLGTTLAIKRLDISFPKMLVLEGVYVEDQTKDTLLAGHQLKVDIDLFQLLNNRVQINEIVLKGITLKLKRPASDQPFNYQFIVDAFATEEENPSPDTSALIMAVDKLILDDTRLVFLDVLTGNDVDVYLGHAQLRIARIDANKLEYDVPQIDIRGLRGRVNQNTPLEITAVNTNPNPELVNEKPEYFKFTNQQTRLRDVDFAYSSEAAAINTNFTFKDLQVSPKTIDLEKNLIALHKLQLSDFTGRIDLNTQAEAELIKLTTQTDQELQTEYLPWKFTADLVRLHNSNLIYNDNTQVRQKSGMDYAHLNLQNLTLHGDDFLYNRDTIALRIRKGQMWEGSGFRLEQLQADFQYTSREVRLEKLWIKTPGSTIQRRAILSYPSVAAIQKNPALMGLNLDIENSRIQVKDLLTFVPFLANQPAFKNPAAVFELNTNMFGSLARLNIRELQFSGFENTQADLSGTIHNATDPDHFSVDLNIRQFSTSRNDALLFVPPNSIPDSITLPESMSLSGTVKGSAANLNADLDLRTPLGNAQVNGTISNAARSQKAAYNATIAVQALQVGTILQQPETLGALSAKFAVQGKGYEVKTAEVQAKGVVTSAVYNKYTYRDFQLDATLIKQQFDVRGGMKDPNLHFTVQATGELGGAYPAFAGTLNIDSIKTGPLHLSTDPIVYRGVIKADVPALNLDSLNGQIYLLNSLLISNNQRVNIDSIELVASYQDGQQSLDLSTHFAQARLSGQYKLTQLGDIFTQAIQPYFAIVPSSTLPDTSLVYDFSLQATVSDHVAIQAFLPDLQRMDDIVLDAHFSSASGWFANLTSPNIAYGANRISGLNLRAQTQGDHIRFTTSIAEIGNGETFVVQGTQMRASIANNQIDFGLRIGDDARRDKYRLSGLFAQETEGHYSLSLRSDSLLLNYEPWAIDGNNQIRFGDNLVNARHFDLSRKNQHLRINSRDSSSNSPLGISFENFHLSTLTGFLQVDSLFADGTLNGNIVLNDIYTQLNFTTDLTINNLEVERDTIGDINAKISNPKPNVFATDISIKGRGNDVALTGNYYLKAEDKSTMDFNLAVKSLQWNTLEGLSMGAIRNGKGFLSGNVKIGNKPTAPDIAGRLGFNETSMVISMLNSEFKIDNEQIIAVENQGLRFNSFTIRDSSENKLTINGVAKTTNYLNYTFDLSLLANNFRALNTSKKDNDLYYGQLFFDTNVKITGTETAPVVEGTLRINESTRLTAVIPQEQPGVVERDGIVVFVDKDAPLNDALFLKQMDTLNKTDIQGMEVSVNIEIDKKAVLNLIVDEGNGDFLRLQGEAVLNGGIDKSGKITLTGSYELEEGAYEMSFNVIRRRFDIQKGSKITWIGEPTNALVDITAVYLANTSAVELIQDQITEARTDMRYQQKLPFAVYLNMDGSLMQPVLTFDIVLPEESTTRIDNDIAGQVEMRLNQLKAEPSELNKQVFALLLLNRFISENPFESSTGVLNVSTLARQSVSKMLTEQLNNLASGLISGVDLNFDIVSSEDYTSGSLQNKTDLNVGLSKRLLNDRLNVSIGTNFELEGARQSNETGAGGSSISPNLNIEYLLSQDGKYLLRAYRRNEYEGVIDGYVVETGIGFVLSMDYDKFKEIFEARKMRRKASKVGKRKEEDEE